jgi:hypothetical protein
MSIISSYIQELLRTSNIWITLNLTCTVKTLSTEETSFCNSAVNSIDVVRPPRSKAIANQSSTPVLFPSTLSSSVVVG